MISLQELITRGRFIFSGAPKRLEVFKLINGKLSTKEISKKTGRSLSSVLQDIEKIRDLELIEKKRNKDGIIKKDGAGVYGKNPVIKHVPIIYFSGVTKIKTTSAKKESKQKKKKSGIHIPNEKEILDICRNGEDQLYEFKSPGTKMETISEEIAAYLHTKKGGIIFYGVDDNGAIIGSDLKRQDFDQRIQNSIRNTISPSPNIIIKEKKVMGYNIILIIIPPWDKSNIYQFTKKDRYLIRKGSNKFALKPNEIKKLVKGDYVNE